MLCLRLFYVEQLEAQPECVPQTDAESGQAFSSTFRFEDKYDADVRMFETFSLRKAWHPFHVMLQKVLEGVDISKGNTGKFFVMS